MEKQRLQKRKIVAHQKFTLSFFAIFGNFSESFSRTRKVQKREFLKNGRTRGNVFDFYNYMATEGSTKIIYVTGGARSGKSAFALHLAVPYNNRVFLATAEPFDGEMELRIGKHREERGERFTTIEEPLTLGRVLGELPEGVEVVLLDCLTVWAGNLMHYAGEKGEGEIEQQIESFLEVLRHPSCDIILVSNEVGMGIVPENAMARRFRDIAGIINQRVASLATEAWLLCSGLPLRLK